MATITSKEELNKHIIKLIYLLTLEQIVKLFTPTKGSTFDYGDNKEKSIERILNNNKTIPEQKKLYVRLSGFLKKEIKEIKFIKKPKLTEEQKLEKIKKREEKKNTKPFITSKLTKILNELSDGNILRLFTPKKKPLFFNLLDDRKETIKHILKVYNTKEDRNKLIDRINKYLSTINEDYENKLYNNYIRNIELKNEAKEHRKQKKENKKEDKEDKEDKEEHIKQNKKEKKEEEANLKLLQKQRQEILLKKLINQNDINNLLNTIKNTNIPTIKPININDLIKPKEKIQNKSNNKELYKDIKQLINKVKTTKKPKITTDNLVQSRIDYIKNIKKQKEENNVSNDIDDIYKLIYSTRKGTKNYEKLQEKWKRKNVFFDIITKSDFYPTPLYVSPLIKKDVDKKHTNYILYDISAGLGSLSRAFIEDTTNIKKIILLEYEKEFIDILQRYEKENKKIKVIHKDFFDYNLKLSKKEESVIICNPPFTGRINNKNEPLLWLYFVIKILNSISNLNIQSVYFVLPKSNLFKNRNGQPLQYIKTEEDKQCELVIPPNKIKQINKYFNIDIDTDILGINYFSYLNNITGFQGINKNGKPTKSPDCALFSVKI